jgi:hypothetical protein
MLQGSVSTTVDATPENIWQLLTERIDKPELNHPEPAELNILQRNADYILRERHVGPDKFVERITVDSAARRVLYTLVNHPTYEGYISHQLLRSDSSGAPGCILAFTVDWKMRAGDEIEDVPDMLEETNDDLFHLREAIEQKEMQQRAYDLAHPPLPPMTDESSGELTVVEDLDAAHAQDESLDTEQVDSPGAVDSTNAIDSTNNSIDAAAINDDDLPK